VVVVVGLGVVVVAPASVVVLAAAAVVVVTPSSVVVDATLVRVVVVAAGDVVVEVVAQVSRPCFRQLLSVWRLQRARLPPAATHASTAAVQPSRQAFRFEMAAVSGGVATTATTRAAETDHLSARMAGDYRIMAPRKTG
jgi:hypothetical protein